MPQESLRWLFKNHQKNIRIKKKNIYSNNKTIANGDKNNIFQSFNKIQISIWSVCTRPPNIIKNNGEPSDGAFILGNSQLVHFFFHICCLITLFLKQYGEILFDQAFSSISPFRKGFPALENNGGPGRRKGSYTPGVVTKREWQGGRRGGRRRGERHTAARTRGQSLEQMLCENFR